jgi:F-type H+-transporting ATPase subunit b
MDIIQTTALITINDTLWFQLLSFLFFLFVINRVMFRPVTRTMAERADHLDEIRRDIQRTTAELDGLIAETAAEENRVREASRRECDALLSAGRAAAGKVLEDAKSEIGRIRKETEIRLSQDLADARIKIATESAELATTIMEAVLERKLR